LKPSARIGQSVLALTNAQYIELMDWSGRQMYPGKRGKIAANELSALARLGVATRRWEHDVKGVRNGYWRAVETAQALIDKAIALGQQWLKGIGYARKLVAKTNRTTHQANTGAAGAWACWLRSAIHPDLPEANGRLDGFCQASRKS
jgi:hypothetical protein